MMHRKTWQQGQALAFGLLLVNGLLLPLITDVSLRRGSIQGLVAGTLALAAYAWLARIRALKSP